MTDEEVKQIIQDTVNETVLKMKMAGLVKDNRKTATEKLEELLRSYPAFKQIDDKEYTVTKIGRYAFNWCTNLTGTLTIPDEVTRVGRAAFANSGLENIASLGGVETLDSYAFQNTGSAAYPFPDLSKVWEYNKSSDYNGGVNHAFENARYSGVAYLWSGSPNAVPGRYSLCTQASQALSCRSNSQ